MRTAVEVLVRACLPALLTGAVLLFFEYGWIQPRFHKVLNGKSRRIRISGNHQILYLEGATGALYALSYLWTLLLSWRMGIQAMKVIDYDTFAAMGLYFGLPISLGTLVAIVLVFGFDVRDRIKWHMVVLVNGLASACFGLIWAFLLAAIWAGVMAYEMEMYDNDEFGSVDNDERSD